MPQDLVIFDIDGTLVNLDHRLNYVKTKPPNWVAFFKASVYDTEVRPVRYIAEMFAQYMNVDIVITTGRNEDYRDITEAKLKEIGVRYNKMYMRGSKDFRPDYIVKKDMLEQIRDEWGEPMCVFDDRPEVVKMWRQEGLFVFDVNQELK